ncbi:hypothetical protein DFA_07398 [Cavenderia fasciculata]|uniref:EGF-like domain-containing protein n=1 Tax=Cavenderia fasciculata TaxID=261658 RepID=F4PWB1_CACFS|nr:uncharacterized protein DFA_07398 [Cavenderia fasciculata]EGG20275.1 hypothetical protein DFA_07398 [Cavenderia fasciculata]|eukprot:XP_004367258.1 hypothetical protein DFA_07398 [Cavenderia fasciculata]
MIADQDDDRRERKTDILLIDKFFDEPMMKLLDIISSHKNLFLVVLLLSCLNLVFAQPTISDMKQDGTSIIITGTGFGTDPSIIVLKSNIDVTNIVILVPNTQLNVSMPTYGQDFQFTVIVGGAASNQFLLYLNPVISSCTIPPTTGGPITLSGYFFRPTLSPQVLLKGVVVPVTAVTTGSDTVLATMTVSAPAGTGLMPVIAKTVAGYASAPYQLWYQAPIITNTATGTNVVLFTGTSFGVNVDKVRLVAPTFPLGTNTSIAPDTTSSTPLTQTSAVFKWTNINVLNGPAQLSIDGQLSPPYSLSFVPNILSMSVVNTLGGSSITITGNSIYPFNSQGNQLSASVTIGGIDCPILSSSLDASFSYLICRAPPGYGATNAVVNINGLGSTNFYYVLGAPVINSVIQSNTDFGITIQGLNFGSDKNVVTMTVSTYSPTITFINDTTIIATLSALTSNGFIAISVDGLSATPFPVHFKPAITSVPIVPVAGSPITITGRYLSMLRANGTSTTMSVLFNNKPASVSSSTANFVASFLIVSAPAGVGANLPLTVTSDGLISDTFIFSYAAPALTSVTQGSGSTISVMGTNFGSDLSVITVVANGQEYVPASLVSGGLTFSAPADLKNGVVSVRVGNQMAPTNLRFSLNPVLTGVSILSLLGVTLGGAPCTNPVATGATLTCQYPGGLGGIMVTLSVSIEYKPKTMYVNFPRPTITSSSLTQNTTDATVTVVGKNFGNTLSMVSVALTNIVLQSVTDTTIIFTVPPAVTNGPIAVTVFGQVSGSVQFVVTPRIAAISGAQTQGSITTLLGNYFTPLRANQSPTVTSIQIDGGAPITSQISMQGTTLTFPLPAGTGANHTLKLTIDGQSATFVFSYPIPVITSIVQSSVANHYTQTISIIDQVVVSDSLITANLPKFVLNDYIVVNVSGQVSGLYSQPIGPILKSITSADAEGGEIKIGGLYLNNITATGSSIPIIVTFPNNAQCTNVVKIADDQDMGYITCQAPPGNGINIQVSVQVGSLIDTINFAYGAPVIFSVVVANDNSAASIVGKNFGVSQAGVSIFFADLQIQNFVYVNSTFLVVPLISSLRNAPITVKLADGRISNPVPYAFKPLITQVSKPVKTTGDQLTIVGSYLYPTRLDGSPTNVTVVIDQNQQCTNALAYGASVICTSPQGSGVNHNVIVYIDDAQSPSTVQFSYIAPLISNIAQQGNSDLIMITGTNLGVDIAKITINNQIIATTLVNPTTLSAKLTGPSKNGDIIVNVDGQDSNTQPLKIKALVNSITSTSPYGGVVELVGKYLWTTRLDSTPTIISIDIGGAECTSPVANGSDGTKLKCTLGDASQFESDIEISIDSVYAYTTTYYTSNPPVLSSISSSFYLVSSVVTIVGNEFYPPSDVTIGGSQCGNAVVVDAQHITCTFDSNVGDNATSTLDVTIISANSDEITFAGVFKYTLLQCLNSCSSHGTCVSSGQCQCNNGYSGADCSITYSQSLVSGDSGSVSGGKFTMFNNSIEFLLSHIQEVRQDNTIVQTIPLTKWDVYDEYGNTTVYNSTSTTHNIELYVTKHSTASVQSYLGDDLVIPSNSIKHFMTIDRFTFESTNSSLRIIYQFKSPSQIEYNCDNETTKYQYDTSSTTTIKSYSIDTPVGTMMASFSNRANIDDTNTIVTSIQAITSVDSTTQSTAGIQYIGIQVPSFGDFVEIDPIFSATSKTAPSTDACVSSSSATTPILLFVVSLILLSIF